MCDEVHTLLEHTMGEKQTLSLSKPTEVISLECAPPRASSNVWFLCRRNLLWTRLMRLSCPHHLLGPDAQSLKIDPITPSTLSSCSTSATCQWNRPQKAAFKMF